MDPAAHPLPGLEIDIDFVASVNYAMQQNDVPLVRTVTIRNVSGANARNVKMRLWTEPAIIDPEQRFIESLAAGDSVSLRDVHPRLLRGQLFDRREREIGHLHVEAECDGAVLGSRREQIAILAYNEWDASAPLDELTAAFVLPNDPAVETILEGHGTSSRRRRATGRCPAINQGIQERSGDGRGHL